MMDTVVAKINEMDHSNKPGQVHTLSDRDDDTWEQDSCGDDNDPMDHLSDIFSNNPDFAAALADFAGGFSFSVTTKTYLWKIVTTPILQPLWRILLGVFLLKRPKEKPFMINMLPFLMTVSGTSRMIKR